jgi:nicotinamidase/pyrazinamidase
LRKIYRLLSFCHIYANNIHFQYNYNKISPLYQVSISFFYSFIWMNKRDPDKISTFAGILAVTITIKETDALIVVDVQNDFLPGGALAVNEGDKIIQGINSLMEKFHGKGARIILTQDWHPSDHLSFAGQHRGKKPFDTIEGVVGIGPVLWPDHCVQGTKGAQFHYNLESDKAHLIIRKGINRNIDSYSAFTENDKQSDTGLSGYLENAHLERIFICGLALDYCVYWSAVDGIKKGFETFVIPDLSKGIASDTTDEAIQQMVEAGIKLLKPAEFE